jgi:hypothetical protein
MTKKPRPKAPQSGVEFITAVLHRSQPRPTSLDSTKERNAYAIRFADAAAAAMAADLSTGMEGVEASPKRVASAAHGIKQLDVNFSTLSKGLALGISLKSVHIREATGAKRYTHNMKRNEEELRIEALGYHKRQPYAVMIAVLFLPFDSCDDAVKGSSSFGSWVKKLRPYAGRRTPHDDADRFEKIYVAVYEPDGSDIRFFDVESAPPKAGRPRNEYPAARSAGFAIPKGALIYEDFLFAIQNAYKSRNNEEFFWDDGSLDTSDLDDQGE